MGLEEHNGKKVYVLEDSQKKTVRENYDKMKLKELAQMVCQNPEETGQTYGGLAIRKYIASEEFQKELPGARVKTTKYVKGDNQKVELNDDQKEFIINNITSMKWLEMAQILFGDERLTPLNAEARAVYEFCLAVDSKSIPENEKLETEGDYKTPISIARLIPRVNQYVKKDFEKGNYLNPDDIKQQERKYLEKLLDYMNVHRFKYQMNLYKIKQDRELAESTFIRYCWGKDDLQEEEVDRYISLMDSVVECTKIKRIQERLEIEQSAALDGTVEGKKMNMTLIEAINTQREMFKEASKRQDELYKALTTSRADRLKKRIERTAAFINVFQLWREEESRKPMIMLAKARQQKVKEEVKRLSDMDALMAEIYGLDEENIHL